LSAAAWRAAPLFEQGRLVHVEIRQHGLPLLIRPAATQLGTQGAHLDRIGLACHQQHFGAVEHAGIEP
jgi:hypothetical protein